MNILFACLITLVVYPIFGTLLTIHVEKLKISIKGKVATLTFGHPLLTALFIWLVCSSFNQEIAETGVLLVAGSLLGVPFSSTKYFSNLISDSGIISITYVSTLLKTKTVQIKESELIKLTQSEGRRFLDKPSELTVTLSAGSLRFQVLDKNRKTF